MNKSTGYVICVEFTSNLIFLFNDIKKYDTFLDLTPHLPIV
jgi:hypothetical protein